MSAIHTGNMRGSGLTLTGEKPIGEQIAAHIRGFIMSGEWAPGSAVPSTRAIARDLNVAPVTVQTGMSQLVKEGLVTRITGRGSFVRGIERRLACVGVYEPLDLEKHADMVFGRTLLGDLRDVLKAADIGMRVWMDPRRTETQKRKALPELAGACARGEIQGLIVPGSWWGQMGWLERLPVPVTILGGARRPNIIGTDMCGFMRMGVQELARRGCRSVGTIALLSPKSRDPDSEEAAAVETFRTTATELGLKSRDPWIRLPTSDRQKIESNMKYGYQQFKAMWREAEQPEGLVVFDDVAAQGVVAALLGERVKVPDDLKLVLHRNAGISHFCPVPASYLELSPREVAETLAAHLSRQFHDRRCERTLVSFRCVREVEMA